MRDGNSKKSKLSWPKTLVKKWFNIKSKAEEFQADDVICGERMNRRNSDRVRRSKIDIDAAQVTDVHNYRIFVATWNVAGKSPPSYLNLEDWLHTSPPADIYVLGFQEIVPLNAGNVLGTEDNGPARKWLALIRKTLNSLPGASAGYHRQTGQSRYCLVASKQMVGIFLTVWVKSDLRDDVRNMKVSCVGRGLMGYLGNKGSISISMSLHQTSFCFICSHLTSGQKEGDELRRNSDVMEILRKTRFPRVHGMGDENSPQTILEHECDRILWYGRGLNQLSYVRGESRFSDHRPVYSVFLAEVESINRSRIKKSMSCSSSRIEVGTVDKKLCLGGDRDIQLPTIQ
ncbi:hypothetical protein GH714_036921 [Hevea brasiliensis]|uniref:Inositol polyphosphate-related phosphatase domain-containing protein n=1 Tax=Hevea brasiliensis TaxID=3981 RepID=A0A6A6MMC2_HEVBR|nr:hypothetical protein GH714_036921 [Hevea brasiliensis]